MDYFIKWQQAHAIPNKEASKVVDALVTQLLLPLWGLQITAQWPGLEFRISIHARVGVEQHVKTFEEHLRKIVSTHQGDWAERPPIFLLAFRASTYGTTGMMPASMVFGSYACPATCCSGLPPTRSSQRPTTWQDSWVGCMTSTIMPVNIWKWLVTRWRPASTTWPIWRDFKKEIKSDPTAQLKPNWKEVAEAPAIMGGPIQGHHPNQQRGLLDLVTSQGDDGGESGQTGATPRATRDKQP